jgi:thiamine biosynthesis lipoprotein
MRGAWFAASLAAGVVSGIARAAEPVTLAGPAMGTTYRVTLAEPLAGMTAGHVHREIDRLLARLDRELSTWRDDSDATRFNRSTAGAWVEIGDDLAEVLVIARGTYDESDGAFDVTARPLVRLLREAGEPSAARLADVRGRVGMPLIEARRAAAGQPAALRKLVDGVELDLDGIGPGYAVDRIGERLVEVGSTAHLVELGGEVRAWGSRSAGMPWRVRLRGSQHADRTIALPAGTALATASIGPGRVLVDPRTARAMSGPPRSITVQADTCARADAWAVAALILDLESDDRGFVSAPPEPSTPAAPPAATPAGPSASPAPANAETPA